MTAAMRGALRSHSADGRAAADVCGFRSATRRRPWRRSRRGRPAHPPADARARSRSRSAWANARSRAGRPRSPDRDGPAAGDCPDRRACRNASTRAAGRFNGRRNDIAAIGDGAGAEDEDRIGAHLARFAGSPPPARRRHDGHAPRGRSTSPTAASRASSAAAVLVQDLERGFRRTCSGDQRRPLCDERRDGDGRFAGQQCARLLRRQRAGAAKGMILTVASIWRGADGA